MRGTVAKRIRSLRKSAGPSLTKRKARKLWFSQPRYHVGETHPKLEETRVREPRVITLRPLNQPRYCGAPIEVRQIYGGMTADGIRPDRGAKAKRAKDAFVKQLAVALYNLNQPRAPKAKPKVYPVYSRRQIPALRKAA